MNLNFKRSFALVGAVTVSSLALVACSESAEDTSANGGDNAVSTEGLSGVSGQLVGEGASSQQAAMDYFGIQYGEAVDGATL
ncbi:MAG: phosphate ABC transporter substrate-binding protein PstS, partial [Corynebacterium sp.]|nr:phosphate ABC transporter substrate-binding protein PstS [Corynebacterium sp.]